MHPKVGSLGEAQIIHTINSRNILSTSFQWFFFSQFPLTYTQISIQLKARENPVCASTEFSVTFSFLQYSALLILVASTSLSIHLCLLHTLGLLGSVSVPSLPCTLETAFSPYNNTKQLGNSFYFRSLRYHSHLYPLSNV